jgi:ketosteroid isomerase-like protein
MHRLTEILARILEFLLVPLLLLVAFTVAVYGSSDDSSHLIALEHAWNQAELQHDPAALHSILADKFSITEPDGEVLDRNSFLANVGDKTYHYDLLTSSDFRVQIHGDMAIITGKYHERGNDKGKPFDRQGRFTDLWSLEAGNWICLVSHDSLPVK